MTKGPEAAAETIAKADVNLTHEAARHRNGRPVRVASLLAEIADQPQLIATSVGTIAVGLIGRRPELVRGGARMLAAHLLATAAKASIKRAIDRTRPAAALDGEGHRFEPGESNDHDLNAFPSGHTAGAVAVARAATREIDGVAAPVAAGVGTIAAIQPVAGNHYLSDVIVGGLIGWVAEVMVDAAFERLSPALNATDPDAKTR